MSLNKNRELDAEVYRSIPALLSSLPRKQSPLELAQGREEINKPLHPAITACHM
jgi:hypothetical protein